MRRHPEIDVRRKSPRTGHNANDFDRVSIESHRAAQNLSVAAKPAMPELFGNNCATWFAKAVFASGKGTSGRWLDAEHVEKVVRYASGCEPLRFTVPAQV